MRRRRVSGGVGCALLFVLLACVACVQSNSAAVRASAPPLLAQPGEAPVLARVGVGRGAWSVAVSARLRRAYVTNRQDDTLSIVDLDTFQIVATTRVGSDPHNVIVDDAAGRAYVTLHGAYGVRADAVAVVATDSGALLATWPTGPFPAALNLDPGLGRLFVLSEGDNSVTVLDVQDGRSVARIDVPGNAMDLAVDAARARVYVASWLANVLLSYDTASLQQVGETALGPMPLRLAVGARAERVYVTRRYEPRGGGGRPLDGTEAACRGQRASSGRDAPRRGGGARR